MPKPKITIVVPVFNAADTLAETLRALARQDCLESFEVIVVDNGSADDSVLIAEGFRTLFSCIRVVAAPKRRGAAYARNVGAKLAKANLLAFIDADDVPSSGWLAAMINGLSKHPFVASRHDGRKLNPHSMLKARGFPQSEGLQQYDYPKFLPHSGGCGLGVDKSLFMRFGGFDETWRLLEDTEFCWRVQLGGIRLTFLPNALVHIRMRPDTKGSIQQAFRWGCYNVRLYKRFRRQMPRIPWRRGIRWWLYFLRPTYMLKKLRDPQTRLWWVWQINWRLGRIIGSLRYRVWAL